MPKVGDVLELTVGEVVHGGWCVARQDDTGWVIFVRHALPGERVLATVTQATARFARAEATADPAGVGRPGHGPVPVCPARRLRRLRLAARQPARPAGAQGRGDPPAARPDRRHRPRGRGPGPCTKMTAGLGWRTVVSFAVDQDGTAGLRRHRSHEIIQIDRCLIAHELITDADVTGKRWPSAEAVEVSVAPPSQGTGRAGTRACRGEQAARHTCRLCSAGRAGPARGLRYAAAAT